MDQAIIVLDANVLVKIFHEEHDTEHAKNLLKSCTRQQTTILVPEHFLYEATSVCQYLGIGIPQVLDFFDVLKSSILTIAAPQRDTWLLAEKVARQGHEKSGFPSMYDSIYHGLAIHGDGTFVTADKRYFAKAQPFKHICLLKDWQTLFEH